jgi:hypothetical protein
MEDKNNKKTFVFDDMLKMNILHIAYKTEGDIVYCSMYVRPSHHGYIYKYLTALRECVKMHSNIDYHRDDTVWVPSHGYMDHVIVINTTAVCDPEDSFDKSHGRHIAETKARISLNSFMKDVALKLISYWEEVMSKLWNWNLEYCVRTSTQKDHLEKLTGLKGDYRTEFFNREEVYNDMMEAINDLDDCDCDSDCDCGDKSQFEDGV